MSEVTQSLIALKLSASSPSAVLISKKQLADPYPEALLKSHLPDFLLLRISIFFK